MATGFSVEAKNYLAGISQLRSPEELKLIESFSQRIDARSKRLFVLIPCYVEETDLQQSLLAYAKSGVPRDCLFVVFVNGANQFTNEQFEKLKAARLAEIDAVRSQFVDADLIALAHQFETKPTLSKVRGLITDAAVMSCIAADVDDPVVVSNDADAISYAADYLEHICKAFDEEVHLDYISGPISWSGMDEDGMVRYEPAVPLPEIYFCDLLSQIADDIYREHSPVYTTGCNSAYRLETICTIGGYDYNFDPFYDVEIGRVLNEYRRAQGADLNKSGRFLDQCLLITNPRRAIYAQLKDIPYGHQFDTFGTVFGTSIDLAGSIEIYRQSEIFLQLTDLQSAERNQGKIRERLTATFLRWLEGEPTPYKKTLARKIAPGVGLEIESMTGEGEHINALKFDWKNSSLISILESRASRYSQSMPRS